MAFNLQRTYALGQKCPNAGILALSSFRTASKCGLTWDLRRTYATESALASKKKGAPSAKATHKATAVDSTGQKKAAVSREHPGASRSSQKLEARTAKGKTPLVSQEDAVQAKKAEISKLSPEEQQIQELEAARYFQQVMRTSDVWGQPVPNSLDVIFPRPAGLLSVTKYPSIKDWWKQFCKNRLDTAKNAISLLYLASDNAIPGVNLGNKPWYKSLNWLYKMFTIRSLKDTAWSAPLRRMALETYVNLNTAVTARDTKSIKLLTASDYQSEILRRVKKQPAGYSFKWNLEREVTPTQILSVRAIQYHLGKEDPKFGSRYLIHALVKFDTEQTLEFYGSNGQPLHEVAEGAKKRSNGTIAAKPKRVTEYLIMEKRLWYDTPWAIREQVWDVHNKI